MTAASKHFCSSVLDNIVDKYNNTYHKTIKMKPININSSSYAEYCVDFNAKNQNLILVIM